MIEKRKYTFNAIFDFAEDGISITFAILSGCISCAFSLEEAMEMAKEALELYLEDLNPTEILLIKESNKIEIQKNQKLVEIEVYV